jgi:long-subunit acyl-CoA synthetase (AMP-forming)
VVRHGLGCAGGWRHKGSHLPDPSVPQVLHLLNDCGAKRAVVSSRAEVEKLEAVRAQAAQLSTTIVMNEDGQPWPEWVVPVAEVATRGHQRLVGDAGEARRFQERAARIRPDAVATIIYTSGTEGDPKGVMLTHRNLLSNVEAAITVLGVRSDDVALSFLPLSHAFERMALYTYLCAGATVVCAESPATLARDMVTVRPTLMTGVPRVFEKLYARVHETVARTSRLRQGHLPLGGGGRPAALRHGALRPAGWPSLGPAVSCRRVTGVSRHSRRDGRSTAGVGIRQCATVTHTCGVLRCRRSDDP